MLVRETATLLFPQTAFVLQGTFLCFKRKYFYVVEVPYQWSRNIKYFTCMCTKPN